MTFTENIYKFHSYDFIFQKTNFIRKVNILITVECGGISIIILIYHRAVGKKCFW